jgi:PIN domain nuclease of toxin-antitoxin system
MSEVVADRHAILWYIFQTSRLSAAAKVAMIAAESTAIHVSAITLVEVAYLIDKGRFAEAVLDQSIDPGDG